MTEIIMIDQVVVRLAPNFDLERGRLAGFFSEITVVHPIFNSSKVNKKFVSALRDRAIGNAAMVARNEDSIPRVTTILHSDSGKNDIFPVDSQCGIAGEAHFAGCLSTQGYRFSGRAPGIKANVLIGPNTVSENN